MDAQTMLSIEEFAQNTGQRELGRHASMKDVLTMLRTEAFVSSMERQ